MAMIAMPGQNHAGSFSMKNSDAIRATTTSVHMAMDQRRLPFASARRPCTGATTAMMMPAAAIAQPYQDDAGIDPPMSAPTDSVRYTE